MAVCLLLNVLWVPANLTTSAEEIGTDSQNGVAAPSLVYSEDSGTVGFDAVAPI